MSPSKNSDGVAPRREVREVSGAQVVEHAHPVAAAHQGLNDIRADEAGPAGHEKTAFVPRSPSAENGSMQYIEKMP